MLGCGVDWFTATQTRGPGEIEERWRVLEPQPQDLIRTTDRFALEALSLRPGCKLVDLRQCQQITLCHYSPAFLGGRPRPPAFQGFDPMRCLVVLLRCVLWAAQTVRPSSAGLSQYLQSPAVRLRACVMAEIETLSSLATLAGLRASYWGGISIMVFLTCQSIQRSGTRRR